MREIFSIRFFAAVGVVVGLFFLLMAIFATSDAIDGTEFTTAPTRDHRIDLVEHVVAVNGPAVAFTVDGEMVADAVFIIDRSAVAFVHLKQGIPRFAKRLPHVNFIPGTNSPPTRKFCQRRHLGRF